MPLFKKRDSATLSPSNGKKDSKPEPTTVANNADTKQDENGEAGEPESAAKQLIFLTQLAHGSATEKIFDFTNVKELYQRIGDAFQTRVGDVLYCTLNTPKINMEKLLGGQIGLEDLIFAHVRGITKEITVEKSAAALGLTITDNGNGSAFIKRIKPDSVASKYDSICVGDHIAKIDDSDLFGSRHFEVAKMLRDFPEGKVFSMTLVEPKKAFENIGPRQSKGQPTTNAKVVGPGTATLRLRSKGPATIEKETPPWEARAVSKVDDLLESFIGIRDSELANNLVDMAVGESNPSDYALKVDEQLGDFAFPDDFIFDVWGAVNDAKAGRI